MNLKKILRIGTLLAASAFPTSGYAADPYITERDAALAAFDKCQNCELFITAPYSNDGKLLESRFERLGERPELTITVRNGRDARDIRRLLLSSNFGAWLEYLTILSGTRSTSSDIQARHRWGNRAQHLEAAYAENQEVQSDLLLLAGRGVRVPSSLRALADRVGGLVYGLLRAEGRR